MAKIHGKIGYAETFETSPGVWSEEIIERDYVGDLLQNTNRYQTSGGVNQNIILSNRISILAEPFAMENSHLIRYIENRGVKWTVSSIEISYPRLVLTLGDVYND